jgi:ABC-2 type transport system permease protein
MAIPRNLMTHGWFRDVATANPVSYLIEGVRSLIITGWDAKALGLAFAFTFAIGGISIVLASWALGQRMART